jgi:phosphoglucosamine mutase
VRFGTDGVRGVANTELAPSYALALGRTAARVLGVRRAVVGGDTRRSTPMFEHALAAGLASAGVDVTLVGVVPTPVVAFEASRDDATLGAVVSASHNAFTDNGVKLFAPGGHKLSDDVQTRIEASLHDEGFGVAAPEAVGTIRVADDGGERLDDYRRHVLAALDGRSLSGLTVALDAANGAGHRIAPEIFTAAGASVIAVHVDPDGANINAGCGATQPESLAAAVRAEGADIGIALDGDGDRCIAVDAGGAVVDGDHILAICATDLRDRGALRADTVVVTVMTNLGFRLAMEDAGIRVVETAVGDRYVLEALERESLSLGGEQSGHVIFRDRSTTGDGILTGLVLADIVARSGRPLSELAAEAMTSLPQVLVNVATPPADAASTGAPHRDWTAVLADDIAAVEAELGDHGRVLVRPSGTEPLVRVMVEAPTEQDAERAAARLVAAIDDRSRLGEPAPTDQ